MFDLIKKSLLTGVGLAAMTKEKIEELAKELAEKGELTEKEGQELVADLLKRSKQAQQDLDEKLRGIVRETIQKLDVATKEDLAELAAKIEQLHSEETD